MVDATSDYSEQMLACIQNCQDCHRACLQTLTYCMTQGGRHEEPEHLRLLLGLRGHLRHQRGVHVPRVAAPRAHLQSVRGRVLRLRGRLRGDERRPADEGAGGYVPPLRRVVRGDGRAWGAVSRGVRHGRDP